MALEARLELFVAIIGEAHRTPVAVETSDERIERKGIVVLGTVTHRVAGMEHEPLHAELRGSEHLRAILGHLLRRLRRDDEVQRPGLAVVPTVAVVRLESGRVD